jgi:NAD(P)-dependent dehydrogenase (short-subunit alcohol dehydrogenase family)
MLSRTKATETKKTARSASIDIYVSTLRTVLPDKPHVRYASDGLSREEDSMNKRILVVGASGDVGQGIVEAAVNQGWTVAAAGRDLSKLNSVSSRFADGQVRAIKGSLASPDEAYQLINEAKAGLGQLDAVVVSVNAPNVSRALVDWDTEDLISVFHSNLFTHFHSAKAALTMLPKGAMLLGIGGGTADFVRADRAQISMAQAALRMMYRG